MEYVLLLAIIATYLILSSKIDKLKNSLTDKKPKRNFSSLKDIVGKEIEIESDALDFIDNPKGILKEYNDTWVIIETYNKKNQKEICYYRLNKITSINVIS